MDILSDDELVAVYFSVLKWMGEHMKSDDLNLLRIELKKELDKRDILTLDSKIKEDYYKQSILK